MANAQEPIVIMLILKMNWDQNLISSKLSYVPWINSKNGINFYISLDGINCKYAHD